MGRCPRAPGVPSTSTCDAPRRPPPPPTRARGSRPRCAPQHPRMKLTLKSAGTLAPSTDLLVVLVVPRGPRPPLLPKGVEGPAPGFADRASTASPRSTRLTDLRDRPRRARALRSASARSSSDLDARAPAAHRRPWGRSGPKRSRRHRDGDDPLLVEAAVAKAVGAAATAGQRDRRGRDRSRRVPLRRARRATRRSSEAQGADHSARVRASRLHARARSADELLRRGERLHPRPAEPRPATTCGPERHGGGGAQAGDRARRAGRSPARCS